MSRNLTPIPKAAVWTDVGWSTATDSDSGGLIVLLRCPSCRHWPRPLEDHDISPAGVVSPSIVCPDCDWHVHGRLEDWEGS